MVEHWKSPVQGYDEYRLESEDGVSVLKLFVTGGDVLEIKFIEVVGWSFVPEFLVSEIPDGSIRSIVRSDVGNWSCRFGVGSGDIGFYLFSTYVPNIGLFEFVAGSFLVNDSGVTSGS